MLEIDCQLTRDGQVVVAHDNSLRRIADIDAEISDFDFSVSIFLFSKTFLTLQFLS